MVVLNLKYRYMQLNYHGLLSCIESIMRQFTLNSRAQFNDILTDISKLRWLYSLFRIFKASRNLHYYINVSRIICSYLATL